jgi:hypothetical protein
LIANRCPFTDRACVKSPSISERQDRGAEASAILRWRWLAPSPVRAADRNYPLRFTASSVAMSQPRPFIHFEQLLTPVLTPQSWACCATWRRHSVFGSRKLEGSGPCRLCPASSMGEPANMTDRSGRGIDQDMETQEGGGLPRADKDGLSTPL